MKRLNGATDSDLPGSLCSLGMLMFYLGQGIFGELGLHSRPSDKAKVDDTPEEAPAVVRDRLIVIGILSFFTIFFWMAFEQAGGSMNIFAKDYTVESSLAMKPHSSSGSMLR